jgi:hypothetical protein
MQVLVGLYCAGICGSVLCRYLWDCTVQVFAWSVEKFTQNHILSPPLLGIQDGSPDYQCEVIHTGIQTFHLLSYSLHAAEYFSRKQLVFQLVKKFPAIVELESSLPYSQVPSQEKHLAL